MLVPAQVKRLLYWYSGRGAPPSCPAPNDPDLHNRIRDIVPAASPAVCREALVQVRGLSSDGTEICTAFRKGQYVSGDGVQGAALCESGDRNPGFTDAGYRTAFLVGQILSGL
jgi:hypothetical protein